MNKNLLQGAAMNFFELADQFRIPGIPATMALAFVALIGYLVGRQTRDRSGSAERSKEDLGRALSDARQLEAITDEMLSATRQALDRCRQLRVHMPPRNFARELQKPSATPESVSA
ncbi:MAG TPA: hypothetical protein PK867_28175 [Pirellulales bacterium]|nr:hypothetical protein [Pirellulales bacterium]